MILFIHSSINNCGLFIFFSFLISLFIKCIITHDIMKAFGNYRYVGVNEACRFCAATVAACGCWPRYRAESLAASRRLCRMSVPYFVPASKSWCDQFSMWYVRQNARRCIQWWLLFAVQNVSCTSLRRARQSVRMRGRTRDVFALSSLVRGICTDCHCRRVVVLWWRFVGW